MLRIRIGQITKSLISAGWGLAVDGNLGGEGGRAFFEGQHERRMQNRRKITVSRSISRGKLRDSLRSIAKFSERDRERERERGSRMEQCQ